MLPRNAISNVFSGAHGAPLQTSFSVSGRALLLSGQQQLSGSEDISRSHGQNQVARLGQLGNEGVLALLAGLGLGVLAAWGLSLIHI